MARARFLRWLGPLPGPTELTAANVARYHTHLVAGGRSTATVKKDWAALNSFLRWLAEHEHVPAPQVRESAGGAAAARTARRARAAGALTGAQYERLVRAAKARIADDPLAGARDLAIVVALGDRGLRCEELAGLERRDFLPARRGAKLRALDVRHGKDDRRRRVRLSIRASAAIVRWDRERARALGAPPDDAPLFVTLGRRRRDGTYTRVGGRCGQPVCWPTCSSASTTVRRRRRRRHGSCWRCCLGSVPRGACARDLRVFVSLLAVLRYLHRLGRARPARAQIATSMPQLVAGWRRSWAGSAAAIASPTATPTTPACAAGLTCCRRSG